VYWRLHLASQPIRQIHILAGASAQVAASDTRRRVRFYDLETGAHFSDLEIDPDVLDNDVVEERREGLLALRAPNNAFLPFVELNSSHLYVSEDGKLRLIHDLDAGLTLEIDDNTIPLEIDGSVVMAHLDRELGTVAGLTEDNKLHIFQQQTRVSEVDLEDAQIQRFFVLSGGSQVLIVEQERLRLIESGGKTVRSQGIHYTVGQAALSPDANWLMVSDADHQLLRLYNRDLIPIRQQHAIDLLSQAQQVQLFVNTPPPEAPLASMDITNEGIFSFAIAGIICTAHVDLMTELPQPRLLL
jgi:hypothetical protein